MLRTVEDLISAALYPCGVREPFQHIFRDTELGYVHNEPQLTHPAFQGFQPLFRHFRVRLARGIDVEDVHRETLEFG